MYYNYMYNKFCKYENLLEFVIELIENSISLQDTYKENKFLIALNIVKRDYVCYHIF